MRCLEQANHQTRRHNFHWITPMGTCRSKLTPVGISTVRHPSRAHPPRSKQSYRWLLSRSFELTQKASIVCPHPLLDEPPLVVKPENVRQIPDDALSVRRQRTCRRLCELTREFTLDPRLAGNVVSLDDDYSSPN